MPSLDIVSRPDVQEIDNTINNTRKQIVNRYDFRGSKTTLEFDRKALHIDINTEDKMKMQAVHDMFMAEAAKRKVDLKTFSFGDVEPAGGGGLRRQVKIQDGLEQDLAKKIVKMIKDKKMKVQASIQGDEVRLSGKKIDDLQAVMTMLKGADFNVALQFVNMKR